MPCGFLFSSTSIFVRQAVPGCLRQATGAAAVLGALLLGGCGFWADPVPPAPERQTSPLLAFMLANPAGTTTLLDDPDFGSTLRVPVEDVFTSATGTECKRATLFSPGQEAEIVVACRNTEGEWSLAPRIWGQGLPPAP